MSESKLETIDFASTITNYDIISIQETRLMPHKLPRWLHDHPDFAITSIPSESARRGTGLLLLHRRHLQPAVWAITVDPYLAIWLSFPPSVTGLEQDLLVAGVYLPPGRLKRDSAAMWAALSSQVKSAEKEGLITLMGDFNAWLGTVPDLPSTARWSARFPSIPRPKPRSLGA